MSGFSGQGEDFDVFYAPKILAPNASQPIPDDVPPPEYQTGPDAQFNSEPPQYIAGPMAEFGPEQVTEFVPEPTAPAPEAFYVPEPAPAQVTVEHIEQPSYVSFTTPAQQPVRLERRGWIPQLITLLAMTGLIFACMSVANLINRDFGHVDIFPIEISAETVPGTLVANIYKPVNATPEHPAPAVLLLHGYQNDKGAVSTLATELAKRGYVVMALDQFGHGDTTVGMAARGFVNQRLNNIFGIGQPSDLTGVSGPVRYRVMLNFSNLDFFNDAFSTDPRGNSLADTSMGGVVAYAALSEMPYVDAGRMAVGGHSMGTWSSWSVAAHYANVVNNDGVNIEPKAIVLQAGELFTDDVYDSENIHFNNVLLFTARYDEFANFRDFENVVSNELVNSPLRAAFLGVSPNQAAFNTTFGSFEDGTARRNELVETNHRQVAVHHQTIAVALDWVDEALNHHSGWSPTDQLFQISTGLVFAAMMLAVFAMVPLLELLLNIPIFRTAAGPIYTRPARVKRLPKWWRGALISMLIAAISYPFSVQLGHGLTPFPENIFRMTIGNGFLTWYLFLIIVMLLTTIIPWRRSRKLRTPVMVRQANGKLKKVYQVSNASQADSMQWGDLGVSNTWDGSRFGWSTLFRSLILGLLMTGYIYGLVYLFQRWWGLDFRIIWPFLRPFNNQMRLWQFLIYLPIFLIFFVLVNIKTFGQMGSLAAARPGWRGFMSCWWRAFIAMAGGILLIVLGQYIPFFMGIGPGIDLAFGSTFGGPFMSLLLIFFPQVIVLSFLCTAIYRKTGQAFLGGIVAAILSCWIITGGSPFI